MFLSVLSLCRKYREFEDLIIQGSKRGKHLNERQRHPSSASSTGDLSEPSTPAKRTGEQASIMNWVGGRAHASQRSIDDKIVDFFVSNMISLRVRNCNYSFYVVDPDPHCKCISGSGCCFFFKSIGNCTSLFVFSSIQNTSLSSSRNVIIYRLSFKKRFKT